MNLFFFTLGDAQVGLFLAFAYGVVFGIILALVRFMVFTMLERKE